MFFEARRLGWARLDYSRHGPDAEAHLAGNLLDGQNPIPQPDHFRAIEDAFRSANRIPGLRPVVALSALNVASKAGVGLSSKMCSISRPV